MALGKEQKHVLGNGRTDDRQRSNPSFRADGLAWCASHPRVCFATLSILFIALLYGKALSAPFVYDDLDQIVKNTDLASFHATFKSYFLSPAAFTNQFRGEGGTNYRPLFWLSLSLDRHIWGLQPAGFHFTNVLLHWLNGLILFLFLRRVGVSDVIAGVTGLLWLGLPINSEPVAWISGRSYLLCGLFLLAALWLAYSYLSRNRSVILLGVFACSFASLLCHESGTLALPLVILLAYCVKRLRQRTTILLVATMAASEGVFLLLRRLVGTQGGDGKSAIWPIGIAFWKYMFWMVAPIHMSIQRASSTPADVLSAAAVLALLLLAALCVAVFAMRKRTPLLSAAVGWCILTLLPFCGVVFIYQGMAERFEYFASAGFSLAIATIAVQYFFALRFVVTATIVLWAGWSAWRLKQRVLEWCDPIALYESSVQATPDAILFFDLGWAWREKGSLDTALENYEQAVRLRPDYEKAQASVGQVLTLLHRPNEALPAYEAALALNSRDSDTRVDYALTLQSLRRDDSAEEQFKKALLLTPENISALNNLGSLLMSEGRSEEAILYFKRAIQARPGDETAYYNLAVLYQESGQPTEAMEMYRHVLQIDPNDADAIANMAKLYQH